MDERVPNPRPQLPGGPYLVVGLARSGIAAATLLAGRGESVIGVDSGHPDGAERLSALGVEVHLDGAGNEHLDRVSAVVKSPGVPAEAPAIAGAAERGIPVLGELELAWRQLPNRFVAVTGTNGKTTVAEWLGHVWREAGREVAVAGNVGTPLASLAGELDPAADVICECSSFQLEDTIDFAPEVAVFLNFSPDHLDRHGTLEDYLGSKLRIFANQGPDDVAVWDADELPIVADAIAGAARPAPFGIDACERRPDECAVRVRDGVVEAGGEPLLDASELALPGEHNLRNGMAVAAAALAAGIEREPVVAGLRGFAGVPHRLERVAEIGGVRFVNDSKATNVAAAIAALRSFEGGVHAILGGSLKGGGFGELAPALAERCVAAYLIGDAAPALHRDLQGSGVRLVDAGDLAGAVAAAADAAAPGETVLLAPACASFDAFRDYLERGERFRELVEARR